MSRPGEAMEGYPGITELAREVTQQTRKGEPFPERWVHWELFVSRKKIDVESRVAHNLTSQLRLFHDREHRAAIASRVRGRFVEIAEFLVGNELPCGGNFEITKDWAISQIDLIARDSDMLGRPQLALIGRSVLRTLALEEAIRPIPYVHN